MTGRKKCVTSVVKNCSQIKQNKVPERSRISLTAKSTEWWSMTRTDKLTWFHKALREGSCGRTEGHREEQSEEEEESNKINMSVQSEQ